MESVQEILDFCNAAILYDYANIGITYEMNQVRKSIINSFFKRFLIVEFSYVYL